MPMPKHLLIAHDLSAEADLALQRGLLLARTLGTRLTLLHVRGEQDDPGTVRARLGERLNTAHGLEARLHIAHGAVVPTVLSALHTLEADLLLIGRHHRQVAEGFAGTTLEQIAQRCTVPLLLAVQPQPWQQALVALDFSPCASRALQLSAALLADPAQLQALHIHEVAGVHAGEDLPALQFERELFETLLAEQVRHLPPGAVQPQALWRVGEREQCLSQVLQEQAPQLLALGRHTRNILNDTLLGSLALQWLRQPPCDLLLVP